MDIKELNQILLHSGNDVDRDDAAELLYEKYWNEPESQFILVSAINSGLLDDSLIRTCAESLVQIWLRLNIVNNEIYSQLTGMPKEVVDAFLNYKAPNKALHTDGVKRRP
jgi:hypothetical protein